MMEFELTDVQRMLRETAKEFVNAEIKPIARSIDENEEIPRSLIDKLADIGFLGAVFPEEYGGGGFGEVGYCLLQEEIGHGCLSTATFIGAHQSIGTNAIFLGGSEALKRKYIPDMASGKKIGAFALTEVLAGSDSSNLRTKARKDGDDWILDGEKMWITNGNIADVVSVFARTERGITGFVVETAWKGYSAGPAEKKMGIRGSATSAVALDGVKVPGENILGTDGRGFIVAMKTLDAGRLGLGAACLGAAKELLEQSTAFSKKRKQFDVPIAQFEAIQWMLADMATMIYNMESIVYRTASAYEAGKAISRQSAMVKLYCSESLSQIADMAVQIHGGMGYSRELPIERFYRDARINRIFEGTNEIQKLVIAKDVLKKNGVWN